MITYYLTCEVIPLGGLHNQSGNVTLLADAFCEPLSRKEARIHGVTNERDELVPHAGGYQAVLEASILLAERRLIDALRQYKESTIDCLSRAKDDLSYEEGSLKAAIEDWKEAMSIKQQFMICRMWNLEKEQELVANFASKGGDLGMYVGTNINSKLNDTLYSKKENKN
ncbi:hypothetical protein NDU88_006010 [Pleurodeles waltl]|uniref:Uncharacterized protein n=1 Tax=Pleurodeles waltl TaxID=8319 RepID=A0AAV7UJN6_PLEWA|nr:hypothetical protein NDU88_006010 [Pleurodeles waltl]